ncbi:hypothetical protein [Sphingosinicella sp.]|uniref:hypothetical protein n=1 Tax=Sphingosinicella sp. TaxID=1917971 RepID=UPI004037F5AB
MKRLMALMVLGCGAAAPACPPPPPGYVPPTREEALRRDVATAQAIVYAVVESPIGDGDLDFATGAFTGRAGTVRILHVYKGELAVDQRVALYGLSYDTSCGSLRYAPETGRRGAYGVLFLHHRVEGGRPLPFTGFRPQADVAEMIRLGLIRSARPAGN